MESSSSVLYKIFDNQSQYVCQKNQKIFKFKKKFLTSYNVVHDNTMVSKKNFFSITVGTKKDLFFQKREKKLFP